MRKQIKSMVAALAALGLALAAQAQPSGGYTDVGTFFSTANGTTTQLVTNKAIFYNITATPNVVLDCRGYTQVALQARFQYLTTSIPATNTTWTFSTSLDSGQGTMGSAIGATNWFQNYFIWATPGSTTDTAFITHVTNITIGARSFLKLDSVLPLATVTNLTLKAVLIRQ